MEEGPPEEVQLQAVEGVVGGKAARLNALACPGLYRCRE